MGKCPNYPISSGILRDLDAKIFRKKLHLLLDPGTRKAQILNVVATSAPVIVRIIGFILAVYESALFFSTNG